MSDEQKPIDILLVGLGSIGTVYSYMLEKSGKARVTAVARSNYALYSTTGTTLVTDRFGTIEGYKPYRVFKSQAEALADGTQYAICIVCTKSLPDVLPTPVLLEDCIKSGQVGAFALIQNGLGVEDDLAAAAPSVPLLSCLAWIGIVTNPTGEIVTWRGVDKLGTGIFPPPTAERPASHKETAALELWKSVLEAGGANVITTDNVTSMRFAKNVWTCTWACLQGLIRTPATCFASLGEEHHAQIKKYMREVVSLGFETGLLYEGMILQPAGTKATRVEETIAMDFHKFVLAGSQHKWSLLVDVEQGRPFEVEVIIGSVVRMAAEKGYPTPLLDFTYTMLKGLQQSILDARK